MNNTLKSLLLFLSLSLVILGIGAGCKDEQRAPQSAPEKSVASTKTVSGAWGVGDCIDQPLSPYVYQISVIEGDDVYLYRMGEMGKKVIQKSMSLLKSGKEPFQKVPCP